MEKLEQSFYLQDTLTAAEALIGCYLVRRAHSGYIAGRINETEAYVGAVDKACHAYGNRRTQRTEPLFRSGGIAYVYLVYGMHHCFNVVTEPSETACAILIRGAEIVEGADLAARNRYGKEASFLRPAQLRDLSNGPGKLCRAFSIDRSLNYESLLGDRLFICGSYPGHPRHVGAVERSKRIGIDYAGEAKDFLWRFTG